MKFHTFTLAPITPARTARYGTNLVPRHGMGLNCLSSQKSWNRTQGQIHGKKFKHMKSAKTSIFWERSSCRGQNPRKLLLGELLSLCKLVL